MAALDLTSVTYFTPVFSFILVLVIAYAVLLKTKVLGESKPIIAITSIILSLIFISVVEIREYVEVVTPWFAVLLVGLFFLSVLVYFGLKEPDKFMKPWIIWIFLGILLAIFLVKAFSLIQISGNPEFVSIRNLLKNEKLVGTLWFLLFTVVTVFVITKKAS